jgi:Ca2+-binding RTX toxin-like protein
VRATDNAEIKTLAGSGAVSSSVSIGGSLAKSHIGGEIKALADGSEIHGASVSVQAEALEELHTISGAGAAGGTFSGVGAVVGNDIDTSVQAGVSDESSVVETTGGGTIRISSAANRRIETFAGAGAGAGTAALVGSDAENDIGGDVRTNVSAGTIRTSGAVVVEARDDSSIFVIAGAGAGAGAFSAGTTIGENTIRSTIGASVEGGAVTGATVDILGVIHADIFSISAIGTGAGTVSGNFSLAQNEFQNSVDASVSGSAVVEATGAVKLTATDDSLIRSLSGAGSGAALVGASVAMAKNTGATTLRAEVAGATVRGSTVQVLAETTVGDLTPPSLGFLAFVLNLLPAPSARIESISIAGAGAAGGAAGASITLNELNNVIEAGASAGARVRATGSVQFVANDNSSISSFSAGVAGAAIGSVGASVADNKIGGRTAATVDGAATSVESIGASVTLNANAVANIQSRAIGLAGAAGGAAGASLPTNTITQTVEAHASGTSTIRALGLVRISASSSPTLNTFAGSAAGAAGGAAGISVTESTIGGTVLAFADGASVSSQLDDVTILATLTTNLDSLTVAGAGAAGAGLAWNSSTTRVTSQVSAHAAGSGTMFAGRDIIVKATSNFTLDDDAGALAGGFGLGFGASTINATLTGRTSAYLADATFDAARNIDVTSESILNKFDVDVFTGAGGIAAIQAAFVDVTSENGAEAYVGSGAYLRRATAVTIAARTNSTLAVDADGGAIGVVAAGGVEASAIERGTTSATVRRGARIGDAGDPESQVGSVTVTATGTNAVSSEVTVAKGGVGTFDFNRAEATSAARLEAAINGNVNVGGDVTVRSTSQGDADADIFAFNLAGLAVAVSKAEAKVMPELDTSIGGTVKAGGRILLESLHNLAGGTARAEAQAPGGALIGVTGADPNATAAADLDTRVDSGAVLEAAADIALNSRSNNHATADAKALTFGAFTVGLSQPDATVSGTVKARVDGRIVEAASVSILAQSTSDADANGDASGGGLIGIAGATVMATVSPVIQASIGNDLSGADIFARGNVAVTALSNGDADAETTSKSGAVLGIGSISATATVAPTVNAFIGLDSIVRSATGGLTLASAHNYDLDGNVLAGRDAHAEGEAASGGVGNFLFTNAAANANANVQTFIKSNAVVNVAGILALRARSNNDAFASSSGTNGGVLAVNDVDASATAGGVTRSTLNGLRSLSAGGLTVLARGTSNSLATADATSGGAVAVRGTSATADANPVIEAFISGGGSIDPATQRPFGLNVSGSIALNGVADGNATATSDAVGGGLVDVGTAHASAKWRPTVTASIGNSSVLSATGDIRVQALNNFSESGAVLSSNRARASADATGGGAISIRGSHAETVTDSMVTASIREGALLTARGDVDVQAMSHNVAQSVADGSGGGVFSKGSNDASISATNTVAANVLGGATLVAGDDANIGSTAITVATTSVTGGAGTSLKDFFSSLLSGDFSNIGVPSIFAVGGAGAAVTVDNTATTYLGPAADVTGADEVNVTAVGCVTVDASASMHTSGVVLANVFATSDVQIDADALVRLDADVEIEGRAVRVDADNQIDGRAFADGSAEVDIEGAFGSSVARLDIGTSSDPSEARVAVGPRVQITGTDLLALEATNQQKTRNLLSHARAKAETNLFVGIAIAHAAGTAQVRSTVESDADSELTSGDLNVHAESNYGLERRPEAISVTLISKLIKVIKDVVEFVEETICEWAPWPLDELCKVIVHVVHKLVEVIEEVLVGAETHPSQGGSGVLTADTINLNGHLYNIGAQNRLLRIKADATVDPASNVDVLDPITGDPVRQVQGPDAIVEDIIADPKLRMRFIVPKGSLIGGALIHIRKVIEDVTIENLSDKNLLLKKIAMIAIDSDFDENNADLGYFFQTGARYQTVLGIIESHLTITNRGNGYVLFTQPISNPTAFIDISNTGGDIRAASGSVYLEGGDTGHVYMAAQRGQLGTAPNEPFHVRLVRAKRLPPIPGLPLNEVNTYRPSDMPAELIAMAGTNLYVELTGINTPGASLDVFQLDQDDIIDGFALHLTAGRDLGLTIRESLFVDRNHTPQAGTGVYNLYRAVAGSGNATITVHPGDTMHRGDLALGAIHRFYLVNGGIFFSEARELHPVIQTETRAGLVSATSGIALLTVSGSIVDDDNDSATDIEARDINLRAVLGGLGAFGNAVDIDSSNDRPGIIAARAFGSIYLTETLGDMRVEQVASTDADVTLTASVASILDALDDPQPEAVASNLRLEAPNGGIGTGVNVFEVDTSNPRRGVLNATARQDIFVTEVEGDLYLSRVISTEDDAILVTLLGSILDGDAGSAANVQAVIVDLWAQHGGIGASADDLDIDSSTPVAGRLVARADQSIDIAEVVNELNVLLVDSLAGSIRLTVPDTAGTREDLIVLPDGRVTAANSIQLRAGDDVSVSATGFIIAAADIEIVGDFGDADPGLGTTMNFAGASDAAGRPVGEITAGAGALHRTAIFGRGDNDVFNFANSFLGGQTHVFGGDGDDRITVEHLQTMTSVRPRVDQPTQSRRDTLTLDGEAGSDVFVVNAWGSEETLVRDYVVNVLDRGPVASGSDTLSIHGTTGADVFLLRRVTQIVAGLPGPSSNNNPAFVTLPHGSLAQIRADDPSRRRQDVERVHYDNQIENVVVEAGDGDDYFALDDTTTLVTARGEAGNDFFQVGQIFKSPRAAAAGVESADAFETILTTRGLLTNGISVSATLDGGDGMDEFVVFRNRAVLNLEGGSGDDLFTIRSFAEEGSHASTVAGGGGADIVQYVSNAAVNVTGGDGEDTLRIIGTEFSDRFVITASSVLGAGRTVTFGGVEKLEVDGAEGNDEFYVLSSSAGVVTYLFGGLGSDSFSITGDALPVEAAGGPMTFPPTSHSTNLVQGALILDGFGGRGSVGGLGQPVMLPHERNTAPTDGNVLSYTGGGVAGEVDLMTVETTDLHAALQRFGLANVSELVGKTIEISRGPGLGRFWLLTGLLENAATGTVSLRLKNPSLPDPAWGLPTAASEFAVTELSINFFVTESVQLDLLRVFNDGSSSGDTGRLSGTALTGLGMGQGITRYSGLEVIEVLLGTGADVFTVENTAAPSSERGVITTLHGGGGADHLTITGGGGPSSPLIVFGDTSQDGSRYSALRGVATPGFAFRFGNAGNDTIDASMSAAGVAIFGGAGDDRILGSQGGDHLAGGSGRDQIQGQDGIDHIYGDDGFNMDLSNGVYSPGQVLRVVNAGSANDIGVSSDPLNANSDIIGGGDGSDILIGDHGRIDQSAGTNRILTTGNVVAAQTVRADNGAGDSISGDNGQDIVLAGTGRDTVRGGADVDIILGDNGVVTLAAGAEAGASVAERVTRIATTNPLLSGNDVVNGDDGNDVILGGGNDDAANDPTRERLSGDRAHDLILGDFGQIVVDAGHPIRVEILDSAIGGNDVISGGEGEDVLSGGAASDQIDGDAGNDLVFGDNVTLERELFDYRSPRFRVLRGESIYDAPGSPDVTAGWQIDPSGPATWSDWRITLPDYSRFAAMPADNSFGDDAIAGGSENDVIFGEWGADVLQGDGSTSLNVSLAHSVSVDDFAGPNRDGDDYIEGGGGADLILGNFGQDDLLGGNSELFGLITPEQRADEADRIFGGSGTLLARNDGGLTSANAHARDADVILGDNGQIFRLVGVIGRPGSGFLTFNYDNYATLRMVPRAVGLSDYTPGGPDFTANPTDGPLADGDIGAADEIHGESGDDFIYGMAGNDVLFGEGQDDDIVGGYGSDWISGGTGDDGVIGDDGRIFTSRNGLTEPLMGRLTVAAEESISSPGGVQQATINVLGRLKKTVDLVPFELDPAALSQDPLFAPRFADDIIFGGLGDDFLHGGAGDDAILGGEALALAYAPLYEAVTGAVVGLVRTDYAHPYNPGGLLHFNRDDLDGRHANRLQAGEFPLYDEQDPLRKLLLNDAGTLS